MGKNDRETFVRDIQTGGVQVFHGQGTVVGWARAGKTTLIKKLKGERDLTTVQTKSLEIHPNVFKVDVEGDNLEVCPTEEMKGPALNISIRHLKSENDLKRNQIKKVRENPKTNRIKDLENSTTVTKSILERNTIDTEKSTPLQIPKSVQSSSTNSDAQHVPKNENEVHAEETAKDIPNKNFNLDMTNINIPFTVQDKDLKNVTILDFGGQSAYYACHHIYFGSRAFHLLVVDASKDIDSKAEEACETPGLVYSDWTYLDYIRYWISSIHTFGSVDAPVIIVASHTEHIPKGCEKEKMKLLYEKIIKDLPWVLRKHIDVERVFAVAKSSRKNLNKIKQTIVEILKEQDHWGKLVPTSWLRLEAILRKLREKSNAMKISVLWEIVKNETSIGIDDRKDMLTALKFFHEIRIILFASNNSAEEFVILNIQWFIDAFQCLIDLESPLRYDNVWCDTWNEFNTSGLVGGDLLESIWNKDQSFLTHKESLLYYMKHFGMLAEIGETKWYVPFMNKQKFEETEVIQMYEVSSTLCFVFEFLPVTIFFQLVSHCINILGWKIWQKGGNECVFHTAIILEHKTNLSHKIILKCVDKSTFKILDRALQYSIEIKAFVLEDNEISSSVTNDIRTCIQDFLQNFNPENADEGLKYYVGLRCRKEIGMESAIIPEERFLSSSGKLECSTCKDHAHAIDCDNIYSFWITSDMEHAEVV
ncbi:uncharacterized protein LOC133200822 [Saccostrea echinata]|uniref:uncharacterized protein LOC133200822 n=1 Tax=Saccostrea echinata TaxID=191078 RepID=UPI002A834D5E|nr:uncharacterized protein LOC133200822 [Saccostrea echinata]